MCAVGFVLLLSACDTVATLTGQPTPVAIDPPPVPLANAPRSAGYPPPSRPIAVMASRSSQPAAPGFVVRAPDGPAAAPSASASDTGAGDVTLNFAGADIRDVVAEVLGRTLHLNYVIDPDVTGPVNFNVSRPLRRDELMPLLETVLGSRGATMVQNDGTVRVMAVRKDGKPSVAAPMVQNSGHPIGDHTEVFPLRFVSATEMQHVLEKVMPAGAVLSPDDARHMLLVQGAAAELQLAQDTIRVFDVDQMSGMSMALVPLRNAEPPAMAEEMRNIFAATRKEADSEAIRFMPVRRLNAVMIISRSGRYMDEARGWIARLDRSRNPNEQKIYVYNLQYSKAVQIGQKLQGLLSGLDIQFKAPSTAAPADGVGAANGGASGTPAATAPTADANSPKPPPDPNGAKWNEPMFVPPSLPPSQSPLAANAVPDPTGNQGGVHIEADEAHNSLLISASSRDYELIRQVLQGIDVPPLQVLIEVTVAEVALNDKLNYGVEYYINSGKTNTLLTQGSSALGITPPVPGFALSWVTGNFQPRAILDALSDVTETRVISTPRLLVLSNQTARLQVGDVVPIITQSATSTVTANPLVLNNVTYKETGVVLEVTPRVNSGGYVTMDVNQAVSDVVNTTTSTIDSPTIRQRRLTSTISVKTGESILLGGLIQQQSSRESSGIPGLSDIPGLGSLFGSKNNGAARTELIMLMTPHVISNDDQARELTSRVEQQFQAVLDADAMPKPRRPAR